MATNLQTIKDRNHRIIGYIETRSDGTQVAKDATHRILGYYEARNDRTEDASRRIIGYGNLLASLIR